MILIDAGRRDDAALDARIVLASELRAQGHAAIIDPDTLGAAPNARLRLDLAPLLADPRSHPVSHLLILGAESLSDATLLGLRRLALPPEVPVIGLGCFATRQEALSAQSRLAYVLGREPQVVDLSAIGRRPLVPDGILPAVTGAQREDAARPAPARPRLWLSFPAGYLDDPGCLPALGALRHHAAFDLNLYLPLSAAAAIRASRFADLAPVAHEELLPPSIDRRADMLAVLGDAVVSERVSALALRLLATGRPVIDGTTAATLIAAGAPALRGTGDPAGLAAYLVQAVLPNRAEIGRRILSSDWLGNAGMAGFRALIGLPAPRGPSASPAVAVARTVFLPTNGNGLGHARRCTAIADRMPDRDTIAFAAFPSCVSLVQSAGYPCLPLVQKSAEPDMEGANDAVNFLRLGRLLGERDRLVFDGGYVFDSVRRTILEKDIPALWIRRGLWQPGQIASEALQRETIFRRIILPQEAFDELNTDYSHGPGLFRVGPILSDPGPADPGLRDRLRGAFDHPVRELIVSMLGGGVAADRGVQLQFIAALAERRPGCLHLVVLWPGGRIPPALRGWTNTRVVQTLRAVDLAREADLTIAAAGYNTVHECLYHGVPAIFMPQMASFMDDQDRRARAAADRGLARVVAATDLLALTDAVADCLDRGGAEAMRAALRRAELPAPGTDEAARLIAEVWA